jgi:chemotaxis protein MotB
MGRRKKHEEEHENHERWLVSYADFITLLFAFFTVMYATTTSDTKKMAALIDGINSQFDQIPLAQMTMPTGGVMNSDASPTHMTMEESASPVLRAIKAQLAASLSDNRVQIGLVEQTLTVSLEEQLLFPPDSDVLHPAAFGALGDVADAVRGTGTEVWVTGRAGSSGPSSGSAFPDARSLAAARANAAVRYLESRGVTSKQLMSSVSGASSDSEAGDVLVEVHADDYADAGKLQNTLTKPQDRQLPPGEGVPPAP